ncbi:MAG: NADH-quinone oxidoreductase subunit J [Chloroflexi bacterium]|nr:NADH-quinone oxidoreductase subunit J [Chloroflexota bacterium]
MVEKILFIVFGALAIVGALATITRKNIIHGLISLIFTFINVALIYLLTQAYFLAMAQILVYAGAILVLFTFVVMFLNLREFQEMEQYYPWQKYLVVILTPLALAEFIAVLVTATWLSTRQGITPELLESMNGNTWGIGVSLFENMLLPFELASLLLVAAMVGAVIMARKEKSPDVAIPTWGPGEEPHPDALEQEV